MITLVVLGKTLDLLMSQFGLLLSFLNDFNVRLYYPELKMGLDPAHKESLLQYKLNISHAFSVSRFK